MRADRRQGERRDGHAQRLRALPDAHGQAPLAGGEPAQDQPAAGGVHRRPGGPGRGEAGAQRGRPVHGGPGQQHRPGQGQARAEHQPLPPAVGGRPPRHQGEQQAGGGAGDQDARLLQGQALGPEGGDQVGQAVLEGTACGHRDHAREQDHPAPAARAGLIRRAHGTGAFGLAHMPIILRPAYETTAARQRPGPDSRTSRTSPARFPRPAAALPTPAHPPVHTSTRAGPGERSTARPARPVYWPWPWPSPAISLFEPPPAAGTGAYGTGGG